MPTLAIPIPPSIYPLNDPNSIFSPDNLNSCEVVASYKCYISFLSTGNASGYDQDCQIGKDSDVKILAPGSKISHLHIVFTAALQFSIVH